MRWWWRTSAPRSTYPDLAHHTILLGPRYRELLDDIFDKKILAPDFSLYLHAPTRTDPSLAPPGCENFYVLSPVPHLQSGTDWAVEGPRYREKLFEYLEQTCIPGLRENLVTERMITPQHFHDELSSVQRRGLLHPAGAARSRPISAFTTSPRTSHGLYFVGAGTHPGAGMPGVLSSAKVVDRLIPDVDGTGNARDPIAGTHAGVMQCSTGAGHRAATIGWPAAQWIRHHSKSSSSRRCCCRRGCGRARGRCTRSAGAPTTRSTRRPSWRIGSALRRVDGLRRRLDAVYEGRAARRSDRSRVRPGGRAASRFRARCPRRCSPAWRWTRAASATTATTSCSLYCFRVAVDRGPDDDAHHGLLATTWPTCAPPISASAMQLTNIARDVGEDARRGRVYLPRALLAEVGADPRRCWRRTRRARRSARR